MDVQREELVKRIRKAFKNMPVPEKIGDKLELKNIRGKRWQDITPEDLNYIDSVLYFTKKGLHYYLPAYLVNILEHPADVTSSVTDILFRDIVSYDGTYKARLCDEFTSEQKGVILEFLKLYEHFFPLPSRTEANSKFYYLIEREKQNRHQHIQAAIEYWESCSGG